MEMPPSIPENEYSDPFEVKRTLSLSGGNVVSENESDSMNTKTDKEGDIEASPVFSSELNTPDSIVVLSKDPSPLAENVSEAFKEDFKIPNSLGPFSPSSPLSSPDSIEILGSESITSPSIEVKFEFCFDFILLLCQVKKMQRSFTFIYFRQCRNVDNINLSAKFLFYLSFYRF